MKSINLDISNVPRELCLMMDLIKSEYVDTIDSNTFKDIDWNIFVELSFHHRLYPILFLKLKQLDENIVPAHVMKIITFYYKRNAFQMLQLSGVTESISRLFSEHHIPLILLKGPALGRLLYGDISLRTSSDLDILVPIGKLEEADRLLTDLGYQKHEYIESVLNDWKWRHHHSTYYHPENQIKLEIHWRLHPGPGKEPSFEELWREKCKSELTSFPVYLLGKEDLLLFLTAHGARHGWSRLRWLLDIQKLVELEMDWKLVNEKVRKYQNIRPAGQGILLASCLLNASVNREVLSFIKLKSTKELAKKAIFYLENMVNLHTDPVPQQVSDYHKKHLFTLMGPRQKCIFLLSFLYPYPDDAKTLPLPKFLHFLYFPLRPFLSLYRRTRKNVYPLEDHQ